MRIAFFYIFSLFILFSCSEEDRPIKENTNASLYGREVNLKSAVLWENNPNIIISQVEYLYKDTISSNPMIIDTVKGYQSGDDVIETGNFSLSLYEEGLILDERLKKSVGKGMNIMFHLSSPKKNELIEGIYKAAETRKKFTFFGYVSSVYSSDERADPAKITEGELNIKKEGREYTIEFNCKTSFGAVLKGRYKGSVKKMEMKQSKIASYKNIKLDGLLKRVMIGGKYMGQVFPPRPLPDDIYQEAFFYTKLGMSFNARDASYNKENIDIALFYDDTNNSVVFKAPITMRKYLDHKSQYTFLNYTKYKIAPSDFTLNKFENLQDIDFMIDDEKVSVDLDNFSPFFVYFETGKGIKGVIYVKSFDPPKPVSISPFKGYVLEWKKGGSLIMDVKYIKSVDIPYLR